MKIAKRSACLLLAGALCLGLAACGREEGASSQLDGSSLAEVTPTPTPTPTPEPESSSFAPAPDLIPPASSSGEEDAFEALFSQNAIDKAYDADYAQATSFSLMLQACDTAARRWKDMADTAYAAALEVCGDDRAAELREEQEKWRAISENRIARIRDEAEDTNEGTLSAAREIVLLYRDRAKALCQEVYQATGALPDFPDTDQGAQG